MAPFPPVILAREERVRVFGVLCTGPMRRTISGEPDAGVFDELCPVRDASVFSLERRSAAAAAAAAAAATAAAAASERSALSLFSSPLSLSLSLSLRETRVVETTFEKGLRVTRVPKSTC